MTKSKHLECNHSTVMNKLLIKNMIYYARRKPMLIDSWQLYHNFSYHTNGILWSWILLFRQAFYSIRNSDNFNPLVCSSLRKSNMTLLPQWKIINTMPIKTKIPCAAKSCAVSRFPHLYLKKPGSNLARTAFNVWKCRETVAFTLAFVIQWDFCSLFGQGHPNRRYFDLLLLIRKFSL